MAAWLAYLKSRLLLPDPEPEQNDEIIDMTDALRYQLLRLEAMQQAAKRLQSLPKLGQARFVRGALNNLPVAVSQFGQRLCMIFWLVMVISNQAERQKLLR